MSQRSEVTTYAGHTLCLSTCVSQDANNMKTQVGELRLLAEGHF